MPVESIDGRRYRRIVVPEDAALHGTGGDGTKSIQDVATVFGLGGMSKDRRPPGTVLSLVLKCPTARSNATALCATFNELGMVD
jgi:hypothetical protein